MNFDNIEVNVVKKSLCEQIAERIEKMILSNKNQAKEKLPSEQTLAAEFKVSRSVIREALTILKTKGLITFRQGGGSYVTVPSSTLLMDTVNRLTLMKDISTEDICQVRIQLEVMSARLAAKNATREQIDALEKINVEMEQNGTDTELRSDLDLKFHQCIAEFSGNRLLKIFVQSLNSLLRPIILTSLCLPAANEDGIEYHGRIIAALRKGNPDECEELIRDHLIKFIRNYETVAELTKQEDICECQRTFEPGGNEYLSH